MFRHSNKFQFIPLAFVELFETEKNHVKILKVLHNVFMTPLEQSKAMSPELIQMVFPPSLLTLKDWHNNFEAALKQRWKEHNALVKEIGDCLNVVSCVLNAEIEN
jgi:Rho guanine nucleotide exchange factor 12